jgi:hypothetical protein
MVGTREDGRMTRSIAAGLALAGPAFIVEVVRVLI